MGIYFPASAEIPAIPDSPALFLVLAVYYGITNDTGKTTGKRNLMNEITP